MNVYKDAHMKMFTSYMVWKNILEKEFVSGITHFPVLVKNILNFLWQAKHSSVQNIPTGKFQKECKQLVTVNVIFQTVL